MASPERNKNANLVLDDSATSLGIPLDTSLGIVVPCHNEYENIPALCEEFDRLCPVIRSRFGVESIKCIFVDDGSTDGTLHLLREKAEQGDSSGIEYRFVSFSRNYGKEAAIYSGLEMGIELECDYFAILDADMQDPPELLIPMFEKMAEGASDDPPVDVVAAYRTDRKGEPRTKSLFSKLFYKMFNKISQVKLMPGARDFRLMTRRVVEAVLSLPESMRFSKGIFQWVGFRTEWIPYNNLERRKGASSWSFSSLFRYGMQGVISFSTAPLELVSLTGVLTVLVAIVLLLVIVVRALLFGDPVAGWPSLICVIIFFAGLQILAIAIIGLYITRIYGEVKDRPLYVIREKK